jgi:hypothetical protein
MRGRVWAVLLPTAVLAAAFLSARDGGKPLPPPAAAPDVVGRLDDAFAARWHRAGVESAPAADPLIVLRRLSLALFGQTPSLEEVRRFETDREPDRLVRWAAAMMNDARFHRFWAERLARAWVGTAQGTPVVYRRDRFTDWVAEQLAAHRPFDATVREMLSQEGTWTGDPATNYVTAAFADGKVDADALAGRTLRALTGQRIECAQCHDDPFRPWKQEQFRGLSAFFTAARVSPLGVMVAPPKGDPGVPYNPERLPAAGTPRERLAAWLTDSRNAAFARETANRVWALLYGLPFHAPVDDLPASAKEPELDLLAADFVAHGYDLRRLILACALARPFALAADARPAWAAFPLTALRPEQVVGSLLQANSVEAIDRDRHLLVRAVRFLRERAFLEEYGDPGESELAPQQDTVARALFRMNGKLAEDVMERDKFATPARVALLARNDEGAVDAIWLSFLTRYPTPPERSKALGLLTGLRGDERRRALVDIAWGLFNSAELAWNH